MVKLINGTLSVLCFSILFAILSVVNIQAQPTPTPTPTPTPSAEPKPLERVIVQTKLHSTILGEDRSLIIHLPRDYSVNTAQKYPVMYVLDGTSQDQHTADKIAVLSAAGLVPSTIVVGIPNTRGNRERDQTPPFMRRNVDDNSSPYGAGEKFLSFIEKELIPFIEANYRTSGYRTLTGNSRGGLFVLYTLLERPDLFQARFCYSTPVWRFDNLMVSKMDEFLRSNSGPSGFLYLSVGEKETEIMVGGFNRMVDVLKKHRRKKFKWAADYTPYAIHQDNVLVSTSKGLLEWGKYFKGDHK
jgi:predicted alpha/beta superfamily hydrolase